MSGGEQQMLAVGRALMSDPKVLMLDEPTTALARNRGRGLLRTWERCDAGLTLIVAEQQVPLALELASRGYVLRTVGIELAGTSEELADNPDVQRPTWASRRIGGMRAAILDGIVLGLRDGLLGVGLTLIYGLAGVLNLAHG